MDNFDTQITKLKDSLGESLLILGHHYQDDRIIRHVHFSGDSLELARKSAASSAKHIVFCGVHFMAESAAILAKEGQNIYLPEMGAGCVMANTAPGSLVDAALNALSRHGKRIIPLTYVNSSLAVKAVCGRHDGSVCTSANAEKMLAWAFEQGDGVLFIPDKNLARNTAKSLGLTPEETMLLDVRGGAAALRENTFAEHAAKPKLFIWPGCCAIHARFRPEQIKEARSAHPGCTVLVHPECAPEVVALADFVGSTSAMIKAVEAAPSGRTLVVGTEWHLVNRLTQRHAPHKTVLPLYPSICSDMSKITEEKLLLTLQGIAAGVAEPVKVDPTEAAFAGKALQTMFEACA